MPQIEQPARTQNRQRPFKLSERRIWPGCIEIGIEGELDLAVSARLRTALAAAEATPCHVLLDFGDCDFIDLSGLAVLAAASCAFAARGRQLLLYGVHGQVRRMLVVTGLTENGLVVAAGEAGPPSRGSEAAFDRSFTVTLPDGESVRLRPLGSSA